MEPALPDLTTARLWLRPLAAGDATALHVARGDPACMRYWGEGVSPSLEATADEVNGMARWGTVFAFGRHEMTEAIGIVAFYGLAAGAQVGFGYYLRRDEWGDGLAPEAARAALDHGFGTVGIGHAELWIDPANFGSIRVAEKIGATLKSWAPLGGRHSSTLHVMYGVTLDEWRGDRRPPAHLNVVPILAVADLDVAAALWRDGLGFREAWRAPDPERAQLLAQWTGGPAVRLVGGTERRPSAVSIQVGGDVVAAVARAAAAGWVVARPPARQPWGTTDAELQDGDGNRVLLAGVPALRSDANGV